MITFNTSDYSSRDALDRAVIREVGTDTTMKSKNDYVIVGTLSDLKRLHLSDDMSIYGVKITANEEE